MSSEERKLAAIVFTDICGFTELMGRDKTKAMALMDQQKPIVNKINLVMKKYEKYLMRCEKFKRSNQF